MIRSLLIGAVLIAMVSAPSAASAATAPAPASRGVAAREAFSDGWALWRSRFIAKDGRVVDTGNAGVSHSEGQGYGMLLAVLADDPFTFDRLWTWTRGALMVREDGLAAWRWDPAGTPHVADMNNASDGDLLIAWALAEAARSWSKPEHRESAARIATALFASAVRPVQGEPTLMPGAAGFGADDRPDGPVINPSYFVFPAYEALASVAPEFDWPALRRSGLAQTAKSRLGPLKLPPDWVSAQATPFRPAEGFRPDFGYNAIRIPLYLAWSRDLAPAQKKDALAPYGSLWNPDGDVGPFVTDVVTGAAAEAFQGRGYKAVMALARCIRTGQPLPAPLLTADDEQYYPATLHLLVLDLVSRRYPTCA